MKKETSCINASAILDYVKAHNNGDISGLLETLDPEINSLLDPEGFLRDPNNWVSCTVISKLYKRARMILHDEMAAYKTAKHTVGNMSFGYAQRILIKSLWSYKSILKNLQKLNDKWNRSKKVELVEIKKNDAIVRLHWASDMDVTKDICLYNQGAYVFMPLIWGGKPLSLKEECCFFEGAPYCEYHFKWPARNRFHEIYSRFFTTKSVLMETIKEMEEGKQVIEKKYEEVNRLNVELNKRINQLMAIQDTGKAILTILDLEQLLTIIMNLLSRVCLINRAIILLVNQDEGCLEYLYAVGFDRGIPDEVKNYRVPLNRMDNILARVTNTGHSEYIPEVKSSKLRKENILLIYGNPRSVHVVPLITRSKVIGVIATDAVDNEGVPKETREMLEIFAPQIAIAIENARLYSRLQDQMEKLKRSHAMLSRSEKLTFLGNLAARLAHEIKNPMTAITTFIQMLPRKFDDEQFRKEFYEIAMEEAARVNNLIAELLDLAKTRESVFEFNDLHVLIDKMILLVSPQSNAKKIEIVRQFHSPVNKVRMDSEKMKQVILNLISNAVEFTPQGGTIEILTKALNEKRTPKNICIEIKDNGVGIHPSMIDKVFDPYFTTKHKSSIYKGTGLGLFIAHQNMQDHGGSIEVKSVVNEGATFILSLPADSSN